jgi:hypothetical protein
MQCAIAVSTIFCLCICMAGTVRAQSIDTSTARLTLGQPIRMSLRVRSGEEPMRHLPAECLQARLRYGDDPVTSVPLQVSTHPEGDVTHVTLSHPDRLSGLIVHARVDLLCGPGYAREFVLLSDPPLAGPPPSPITPRRARKTPPSTPPQAAVATPPAPAATPLDQTQLQLLASAVRALLQIETTPSAPQPSVAAEPAADPVKAALLRELDQLRLQQDRTAMAMNELLARLEAQDRLHGLQSVWLLCSVLLTWLATRLLPPAWEALLQSLRTRLAIRHRPHDPAPAHDPQAAAEPQHNVGTPLQPGPPDRPPQPTMPPSMPLAPACTDIPRTEPRPSATRRQERRHWPVDDQSQPSLQSPPAELLDKLDGLLSQGYPGACAVVLEQALQDEPLKPPWLLLRLLEVYRQLGQPANHEGVCAQLEALYNVRVPALDEADEGAPLIEQSAALQQSLCTLWSEPDRIEQLAGWLLRPSLQPALDLRSFSELLWLHGLACALTEPATASALAGSVQDERLSLLPSS